VTEVVGAVPFFVPLQPERRGADGHSTDLAHTDEHAGDLLPETVPQLTEAVKISPR
jgi:hypothetical protein